MPSGRPNSPRGDAQSPDRTGGVWLIANPMAGSDPDALGTVRSMAEGDGAVVRLTEGPDAADRAVREAVEAGAGRLVVAGGDGTFHGVVASAMELADRGAALPVFGLIPTGTANDLARALSVPVGLPDEAWRIARSGAPRPLDVLEVTVDGARHWAVNNVFLSALAAVLRDNLDAGLKQRWGPLAYLRAAIDASVDLAPSRVDVCLDGGDWEQHELIACVLGNGETAGGGIRLGPEASCSDGAVDVLLVRGGSVPRLAGLATRVAARGAWTDSELVSARCAERVEIRTEQPTAVRLDGEDVGRTPIAVRCVKHAVLVAAAADD